MGSGLVVQDVEQSNYDDILSPEALRFVERLQVKFGAKRDVLLAERSEKQREVSNGNFPGFLEETSKIRESEWTVASAPNDLEDRRVEITGPVDRKMMINALNSGAKVFMADLEDSLSPTWENVVQGQVNLRDAVRGSIEFSNPDGRQYRLNDEVATLVVRPRGWHLVESNVQLDNCPVSASLFDFGLYFFHNAHELLKRGSGPYFYLPKLQSHLEARLWNDVFLFAQEELGIPRGTIRATVLVEHIQAAFEMDEILFELREHASGLNAGRWDYIFSMIKVFQDHSDFVLPDRSQVTMTVPFMHSYTELLVKTCHRRGAHAMGGMAAFIPNRRDPEATEVALSKVQDDKKREAKQGFDGTWVAHPALVPVALEPFNAVLGAKPTQKSRLRDDVQVSAADLRDAQVPEGAITTDGVRSNVSVALQYINSWLQGTGAAAIFNLMEDAATAEISRAQLWQWIQHEVRLETGRRFDAEMYRSIREEELEKLGGRTAERYGVASQLLDELVLSTQFPEFLTIPAYEYLNEPDSVIGLED